MPPIKCFSWSTPWASKGRRVITRSIFARFLFAFAIALGSLLWAGGPPWLSAEVSAEEPLKPPGPPPSAATRQEVWQAVVAELQRQGLWEQQPPRIEDLDLPGALPALAGRRLRVSSACWDEGPRRTQFRLECGEPGQCLPFLVYLHNAYLHSYVRDDQNTSAQAGACR